MVTRPKNQRIPTAGRGKSRGNHWYSFLRKVPIQGCVEPPLVWGKIPVFSNDFKHLLLFFHEVGRGLSEEEEIDCVWISHV